ncbi:MAG TPA: MFS transporter [Acidothermaceae bacterium]|nr:MFS transporter [Acidothermaceae bacterium]
MEFSRLFSVFRLPSVRRLLAFALLAELPAGMTALAIVLRITQAGGTYARGGLISGVSALGVGVSAPLWSRLIDRRGQTVVLIPTGVAVTAAAFLLALLPPNGALLPLLLAALLMGLVQPPALVSARTLWPKVVRDPVLLETTYSVESAMTELVFIVGPLLAVAVTALLGPAQAVAGSGLLAGVGAFGLATSAASRRTHGKRVVERAHGALRSPAVRVLVLTVFAMVIAFAAIDVATIAAARGRDTSGSSGNGAAGIMIAFWGIGSMVGGLAFGSRSWPGRRSTKILVFVTGIVVLTAVLVPLSSLVALTVVLFLGGLFYAPSFSCINQAVQRTAMPGASTESFAWIGTGALVGASIGSTIGGFAVTHGGVAAGYAVATASLVVALAVVFSGRRAVRAGDAIVDTPPAHPVTESVT